MNAVIKRKGYGKYLKYVGKQIENFEILGIFVRTFGVKKKLNMVCFKYKCLFCGNISIDQSYAVLNIKKSCGCNKHRINKETEKWNDDRKLRKKIRNIVYDQCKRCNNPEHKFYKYYGGRGVQFKFKSARHAIDFYIRKFGEKLKNNPHLSIDRIDNNGHYEPGNVRLATKTEQQLNTKIHEEKRVFCERKSRMIEKRAYL